jgi:hypothetical protein
VQSSIGLSCISLIPCEIKSSSEGISVLIRTGVRGQHATSYEVNLHGVFELLKQTPPSFLGSPVGGRVSKLINGMRHQVESVPLVLRARKHSRGKSKN